MLFGAHVSSSSDGYAEWAPYYPPRAHNALMQVEQSAVLGALPPVAGCTALDAGCGTGRYARTLRERGARLVVGVDLSLAMLHHADDGWPRVHGDLRALPLADATFDLVVSGLALIDIDDLSRVLAEWGRILRPGGVVVYSTLHPNGAKLGWTRTFDTPRGRRSLPACWHDISAHRAACASAALAIDVLLEPCLQEASPVALVIRASRVR
jgi:malonyl-CoA O-methyltransferase